MCGRAYSPRFLYMLPSAKISVMGGTQAAEVLSLVKFKKDESKAEEIAKFKANTIKNYEDQGSSYYSTGRLWDDGVVRASDLRRVLGMSLVASLNQKIEDTDAGVFRF